ncbi:MAG: translation initiation factor IF-2 [Phascolarctobacterium sp.]|nr:MAG: translation initiation factor IF-2 [Phascolarctobacterium sp.]
MGKHRVYEIAKELGKTNQEVIDVLAKNNIQVKSLSTVDDAAKDMVVRAFTKKPVQPEKKPAPQQKPQNNAPKAAPAKADNKANAQKQAKPQVQNQPKAAVNNKPQQDNRPKNQGSKPMNAHNDQRNQNQNKNNNNNQNQRKNNQPAQQQGKGNQQGQHNKNSNKPNRPQRPQGGIFIGPRGQQAGQGSQQNRNNSAQQSHNRFDNQNRNSSQQGGKQQFNKKRNDKPQIKGQYASRDSRNMHSRDHMMKKRPNSNKQQQPVQQAPVVRPTRVEVGESINVKDFANLIKREVNEVIKSLFMLGVMVTINQDIDFDTAELVGSEFDVEVVPLPPEEDPTEIPEVEDDPAKRVPRPPVITVMGHVDHGKTSLLDAIRKSNVTSREAGGITQHIGAYMVNYQGKKIVFLDTPGHEAFTAMRARGAQVTDVAILVVAADDGVMPQTVEAINHAKAAKVPIIVAINKMDRPGANPDHVKQQLAELELIPEDWGGDTIMVPVSAHQKTGISELLEMILLVAEMQELKANPNLPAHGTIIEAQLDKGRGPVATVLVQRGTLSVGDTIIAGTAYGKVRAMINDRGEKVKKALPSTPVEVLGLNEVPMAGDILDSTDEKTARSVAEKRLAKRRSEEMQQTAKVSLDDIFQRIQEGELKELNIVVKADVQGTIEALKASLTKIKNDEVKVVVVHSGVGSITESDVMLASAANALIIGFNVRPDANARKAAETEKVDVRTYRVIYDAINDVEAAIKGMLAPKFKEVIQGRVEVRQLITISKLLIAGCYVLEGKVTNSSKVRVVRDGIVVHEGEIDSLRRFKDDVKEVVAGFECGITLDKFRDLKEGDIFEVYSMEEVAAE